MKIERTKRSHRNIARRRKRKNMICGPHVNTEQKLINLGKVEISGLGKDREDGRNSIMVRGGKP